MREHGGSLQTFASSFSPPQRFLMVSKYSAELENTCSCEFFTIRTLNLFTASTPTDASTSLLSEMAMSNIALVGDKGQ